MTEFHDLEVDEEQNVQNKALHASAQREADQAATLRYFFRLLARLASGDVEELLAILPQLLNMAISEPTTAFGIGKILGPTLCDAICDLSATLPLRATVLAYLW